LAAVIGGYRARTTGDYSGDCVHALIKNLLGIQENGVKIYG
jgi:hypothetical protein